MNSDVRSTPLRDEHIRLGAKMVNFAGWYMPVEYRGLRAEHQTVREKVGLFDVSHMGEIRVKGPKSLATVEWLTSNDVAKLKAGQAQYSLLTNANGGVVDDLIVYCVAPERDYLLCVNAANTDKDLAWIKANNRGAEKIVDESAIWGQIAVQGPSAIALVQKLFKKLPEPFHFTEAIFQAQTVLIARTGYTGEDGVEIFVPAGLTVGLWRELLWEGASFGVEPIGLGARDTLRTEMKYPLYGHELSDQMNPYAAGLGWVIKPAKKDFIGRERLIRGKELGLKHQLVGLILKERGIPRAEYKIFSPSGEEIGWITSGTMSPTLNEGIGIGYVAVESASVGSELFVDIRGRKVRAQVVPTPFVNRNRKN